MANENRNTPAQQGDRDTEPAATGNQERMRGDEEVRGIAEDTDEEFEDTEDLEDEDEEEEEDKGNF
jgi:hypothetical protein